MPAPVTISARSGARSASQAKATVSSPIISGLIALKASGRSRVRVPISPSISIRRVLSSGGLRVWVVISLSVWREVCLSVNLAGWPGAYPSTCDRRWRQRQPLPRRADRAAAPRAARLARRLPLPRRRGDGEILYVGKARSIRKRVASHFSGGESRLTSRVDRIECLVTATEAEALLAEQSFIKRHRPRFNIRLRDDKSYPYVAVSLDEDYPRVYFTREKHRPGRAYFGPFSSAKRVRETLDLLGKLFQFRTCEGPSRAGAPAAPASTTTSSAAGRPASATSAARSTGATSRRSSTSSPAATARSRARSRRRWRRRPGLTSSSAPPCTATG